MGRPKGTSPCRRVVPDVFWGLLLGLVFFHQGNAWAQKKSSMTVDNGRPFYFPLDAVDLIEVSSVYGSRVHPIGGKVKWHHGVDLMARKGKPVYAVAEGKVVSADYRTGFGNSVVIAHPTGMRTRYAHLWLNLVESGMEVERGRLIGLVGETGHVTGPHLHFEIWLDGVSIDPFVVWRRPSVIDTIKIVMNK